MKQFFLYLVFFLLGAVIMAHNPSLIKKTNELTTELRIQIQHYTGKADREVERQKLVAEEQKRKLEEAKKLGEE